MQGALPHWRALLQSPALPPATLHQRYGALTGARAELPDLMPVGRGASAARDCPQRAVRNVQIKDTCLLGLYNTEEKQRNWDGSRGTTQDSVLLQLHLTALHWAMGYNCTRGCIMAWTSLQSIAQTCPKSNLCLAESPWFHSIWKKLLNCIRTGYRTSRDTEELSFLCRAILPEHLPSCFLLVICMDLYIYTH